MSIDQILGLVTGVAFGFLLQKGRVVRFEKQIGALLIKDMTIFKFMLSSILVGMVGIFILSDMGIITFSHKPLNVGAVGIGAILFGIGWAVMGFCPGTSVAAVGEGRVHAFFAIAGMLVGDFCRTISVSSNHRHVLAGLRQNQPAGRSGHIPLGACADILGGNDRTVCCVREKWLVKHYVNRFPSAGFDGRPAGGRESIHHHPLIIDKNLLSLEGRKQMADLYVKKIFAT
jgi:hypothetical protein